VIDFQEPFAFAVAVVAAVVVAAAAVAVDGYGIVGFSICVVLLVDARHKITYDKNKSTKIHIKDISFKCSLNNNITNRPTH